MTSVVARYLWIGAAVTFSVVSSKAPAQQRSAEGEHLIAFADRVTLAADPTVVRLTPGSANGKSLAHRVEQLAPNQRLFLTLEGLSAREPPGVVYSVYLDLPPDPAAEALSTHLVGSLNFFSVVGTEKRGFRSFDITDLVGSLHKRNALKESTTVTIRPGGKPSPDAKAVVSRIEIVDDSS
jgi:hypothetical protein